MKIKNVNLIERHIEKVFIAISLAVLIFTVWTYGLNTPNTAYIDGQNLKPGEIDPAIETRANALNQQINSNDVPQALQDLKIANYTERYFDRISQKIAPVEKFNKLNAAAYFGVDDETDSTPRYVPTVPAPVIVAVQPDLGAISQIAFSDNEGLADLFTPGVPTDLSWISLVGQFDLHEMRKELLTPSSQGVFVQIDRNWWETQFAIVSFEVQKQTALPDGSFSDDPATFKPVIDIPGQPRINIPESVTSLMEGVDYQQLIQLNQEVLTRYPFYPLKGRVWESPTAIDAGLDLQYIQEVSTLYQAVAKGAKDTEFLIKRRNSSPQNELTFTPKVQEGVIALTNAQRDFYNLTNTTVPLPDNTFELNLDYQSIFRAEKENEVLAQAEVERIAREAEFAERLRLNPNAQPVYKDTAAPIQTIGQIVIPQNGQYDIWAHDINVKPGESYRYRMRVSVTNPLWQKKRNLPTEQDEYLDRLQLESDWGAWSSPITIQDTQFVFLDKAQSSPAPIPGLASVDVWKFWDGMWRNNSFDINPGDPIGSIAATDGLDVNYYNGANLVDIDFQYKLNNRATPRMIYTQNGQTRHRIQSLDRTAPMRDYLKTQKAMSINYVPASLDQ